MIIYLAGGEGYSHLADRAIKDLEEEYGEEYKPYLLMSYYYAGKRAREFISGYDKDRLLIDSGAFSFMTGTQISISWDEYARKYAEFINEYDIKYYIELDIDAVVGYDEVKRLRSLLEDSTRKKCIPVWHKSRGLDEFYRTCHDYDYVALGGLVNKHKAYDSSCAKAFNSLTRYAWSCGTRVHALGFTKTKYMQQYNFYSADSTTWLNGIQYGLAYYFDGVRIVKKEPKARVKRSKELVYRNLLEWIKYQKYMLRFNGGRKHHEKNQHIRRSGTVDTDIHS